MDFLTLANALADRVDAHREARIRYRPNIPPWAEHDLLRFDDICSALEAFADALRNGGAFGLTVHEKS